METVEYNELLNLYYFILSFDLCLFLNLSKIQKRLEPKMENKLSKVCTRGANITLIVYYYAIQYDNWPSFLEISVIETSVKYNNIPA